MNSIKFMRILVLFDLPVTDYYLKTKYSKFRRFLLNDGYDMLQYSVYVRLCRGLDGAKKHLQRLEAQVPQKGAIRAMLVTEKQYENMYVLSGTPEKKERFKSPMQLVLV